MFIAVNDLYEYGKGHGDIFPAVQGCLVQYGALETL